MANPEHLAKLQEGVEAWNSWRRVNQAIQPDLSETVLGAENLTGADFTGANLAGVYLRDAILAGADFSRADLSWADLFNAHLGKANLSKTNLRGANLRDAVLAEANLNGAGLNWANLFEAHLGKADLRKANLAGANLCGAYLCGANLTSAALYKTIFANVNLRHVKGLESCRHDGPSIIDHRTLSYSGRLPLSFLRGFGLPDTFIDYLPSLLNQPIQFYSCFISYSSKDKAFAQRLHADLQDKGVRCWFAPEDMKIGDKLRVRIDEVIRIHDKLLLVLSRNSVASAWVEKEVETAFDKEIERKEPVLFPIRLDNAVLDSKTGWAADIRRSRHIGDFCNWENYNDYQKGLERLLRDLQIEKDAS